MRFVFHHLLAVSLLLVLAAQSVKGQSFVAKEQELVCFPAICCEEDCCGDDTFWEPDVGLCFQYEGYPGFDGVYPDDHVYGYYRRKCCLDECCAAGTVWDESEMYCVGDNGLSQAPSSAPTKKEEECTVGDCSRFWNGSKEMRIDFGSDDIIKGLEDAMDSVVAIIKNVIEEIEALDDLVEDTLEKLPGLIRDLIKENIIDALPAWYNDFTSWLGLKRPRPALPNVVKQGLTDLKAKIEQKLKELKERLEELKTKIIEELKKVYREKLDDVLPDRMYDFEGAASQCGKVLSGPQVISKTDEFTVGISFDLDVEEIGITVDGKLKCNIDLSGPPKAGFNVPGGDQTLQPITCQDPGPKNVAERKVITVEAMLLVKILVVTATIGGKANDIVGDIVVPIKPQ